MISEFVGLLMWCMIVDDQPSKTKFQTEIAGKITLHGIQILFVEIAPHAACMGFSDSNLG